MKILILHGPNTNLIGLRSLKNNKKITLDKINQEIRKYNRNTNLNIKIIQTNKEDNAITYIQNNRNKINGIIITPGPWQSSAFILKDLLELTQIPFITISYNEKNKPNLLNGFKNIYKNDILLSYKTAIEQMIKNLT